MSLLRAAVLAALLIIGFKKPALGQTVPTAPSNYPPPQSVERNAVGTRSTGRVGRGESISLPVKLNRGEFVRATISVESGALRARLLGPRGEPLQVTWAWSFFVSLPLAMEAPEAGEYSIELSVPTSLSWVQSAPYEIEIKRESATSRAARRADLDRDARVAYLRTNVEPMRSIAPADADYSDLEWLRGALKDVRVVMLGEGDHGGASDLLAQTRLAQFLHERMAYDVIAFESGIHSTHVAWRALQTGTNPIDSFQKGVFGVWARAAQAKPLIDYLVASAHTERPLVLAGFDCQLTGTAAGALLTELRTFLRNREITSPFTDEDAAPSRVVDRLVRGDIRNRDALPTPTEQAQAAEALGATAAQLDSRASDRDAAFWAQVLRSTAVQFDGQVNLMRGGAESDYMAARDRQMTDNLLFLANRVYPNSRIVVVAHTAHVMRSPQSTIEGRQRGFTMGEGVWAALGTGSFSIAFTSYDGTTHWVTQPEDVQQDVIPGQQTQFDFETLMNAAGHRLAFVNLRAPRPGGDWLLTPFTASALYLRPQEAPLAGSADYIGSRTHCGWPPQTAARSPAPRRKASPHALSVQLY